MVPLFVVSLNGWKRTASRFARPCFLYLTVTLLSMGRVGSKYSIIRDRAPGILTLHGFSTIQPRLTGKEVSLEHTRFSRTD